MQRSIPQLRSQIPAGAGLGLRRELWHETLECADDIDFVEIIIDDYLDAPLREVRDILAPVRERFTIVAHGVRLSVGSAEGIDLDYVERVARVLDALEIEVYTEHLSFRRGGAHEVEQFVPLPFTQKWADRVAQNVRTVQRITGRTIALENVTYLLGHPGEGIGEAAFVRHVAEEADCGLLLDVTNLLINAANFDYSTATYLQTIPSDRIVAAHIAGGHDDGRFYVDSHSSAPPAEALSLLRRVARETPLRSAALERDKDYPETMAPLLEELDSVRTALRSTDEEVARDVSMPPLHGTCEPAECVCDAEVPDADALTPQLFQRALAGLLQRPGAFRRLRGGGGLPDDLADSVRPEERDDLIAYLLSFPPERVKAFRKVLHYKRREKIESVLPGTFELLGDRSQALLSEYFRQHPEQSRSRVDEGILFARFVASRPDCAEPLRSMAVHEEAVLRLKSQPYRIWHILRRPTTSRSLNIHPRALDEAIHHGADVPAPESQPYSVRYERRRQGVWVEVINHRSHR